MERESSLESAGRLILGLGNPGDRYRDTRHNLGFRVVDELARRSGGGSWRLECNTLLLRGTDLALGKPQTWMNRSGHAARCLVERFGYRPEEILVIFDEVHLPLGRLRMRRRGSPGGHRGMESIIGSLRTEEIPRLRLGVGEVDRQRSGEDLVDFVLSEFREHERTEVEEMVKRGADAVESWLRDGIAEAMNRTNG
jgi:PTH1 family peptidyl-tRNA hydrolase